MKTILALASAALLAGSAYGQTAMSSSSGTRHMFEFNADSVLQGILGFDKSKSKGNSADNSTQLNLDLNYAYSLESMPRLQLGGRLQYMKGTVAGRGDAEDYGFQVGGVLNHTNDLQNALYASLYIGMGWANTYGSASGRKDEVINTTLAVGKRFGLERWGIKHLTYTPEIALQNRSSTTGSALEYSQSLQFRFLQFSVFF